MIQIIISIIAGLSIKLFFQLVKYRDELNEVGPSPRYWDYGYIPLYRPTLYMSVLDFLSGGRRKWGIYILFRTIPPLLVLLVTAAVLQKYFYESNLAPYLALAAAISVLFSDAWMVWRANFISEKLLHLANIVLTFTLAALFSIISSIIDISYLAPSVDGIVDSLWSVLLVSMIVLFYSKVTTHNPKEIDINAEKIAKENYVFNAYNYVQNEFGLDILTSSKQFKCSVPLLYSVLIYENLNRPKWLRGIENMIVKLTKQEMTVGIAQVKSDRVLSDGESIFKAARILKNSDKINRGLKTGYVNIQQLEDILKDYNNSSLYAASIADIISVLKNYAREIFEN